jgi:large subunit ribosomal protein L10
MPKLEKEIMIDELKSCFKENPYVFFSSIAGLSVEDISGLRRSLEPKSKRALVVKNSLARRVLEETGANGSAKDFIEGQVLVAFGDQEPQDISKAFVDFGKENEKLVLKGAIIDGKAVKPDYLKQLAKLPSKQELLGKVVAGINAPISGFVLTLGGLIRSFAIVLNRVAEKKNQ